MHTVQQKIDELYKQQYGKMIAMLLYCFRNINVETAEDIVQDAFSSALTSWTDNNMPANMEGWLFMVCRNKAINKLKQRKHLPADEVGSLVIHEAIFPDSLIKD